MDNVEIKTFSKREDIKNAWKTYKYNTQPDKLTNVLILRSCKTPSTGFTSHQYLINDLSMVVIGEKVLLQYSPYTYYNSYETTEGHYMFVPLDGDKEYDVSDYEMTVDESTPNLCTIIFHKKLNA